MKQVTSILTGCTLVFLIYSTPALGQSLDRMLKEERARRSKLPASARVYTNRDLEQFKAPATAQTSETAKTDTPDPAATADPAAKPATPAGAAPPPAKEAGKPEPAKKADADAPPARDESYWRKQAAEARAKVQSLENKGDVLQLRLSDLTNKAHREQDVTQRETYQVDIQKTLADIDEARSKLEAARRDLEDVERQARRENVPPGWIR